MCHVVREVPRACPRRELLWFTAKGDDGQSSGLTGERGEPWADALGHARSQDAGRGERRRVCAGTRSITAARGAVDFTPRGSQPRARCWDVERQVNALREPGLHKSLGKLKAELGWHQLRQRNRSRPLLRRRHVAALVSTEEEKSLRAWIS